MLAIIYQKEGTSLFIHETYALYIIEENVIFYMRNKIFVKKSKIFSIIYAFYCESFKYSASAITVFLSF